MSLSSKENWPDRLLRLSPWLAGVLVGLCVLALLMRLFVNDDAGDGGAIAAQATAIEERQTTDLEVRHTRISTDSAARRTQPATDLEIRRTGEIGRGGSVKPGEALLAPQRSQTPSSKSQLAVHGLRGSPSQRESNLVDRGHEAGASLSPSASAESPSNSSSTRSPIVRSTASRLTGGAFSPSGAGHTSFFGVEASGRRFAYVLDRSGSMGDPENKPLFAAKQELLASLSRLGDVHQFFVIFYNEEPAVFNSAGAGRQLVFANELNKQSARRFVESIQARGGTRHYDALSMAIALRPDVIFLLTDGEPKDDLAAEQLARLARLNEGIAQIHVIQFADSPYENNSLVRLAKENRGQHTYKDLSEVVRSTKPRP